MKRWIPITGIVGLLAAGGYWFMANAVSQGKPTTPAASAAPNGSIAPNTVAAGTPVAGESSTLTPSKDSTTGQTSNVPATPPSATNTSASTSTNSSANGTPAPALTRALEPSQAVVINERPWAVLGTRDVPQGKGQQKVLILRDEASGQLDYRQSALRFELQPGADYEAFIRERRNAQRLFANLLYGEIAVDAANIAAEYTTLAADKRVLKVQFIPLVVPVTPR